MDLYEARRLVVQRIVDSPRFGGSNIAFSQATDISPSYVSRMLKEPGSPNRKRIGDDTALKIESKLDLRPGEVLHPANTSRGEVIKSATTTAVAGNTSPGPDMRGLVPLISFVQAGSWGGAIDPLQPGDAEAWLQCPKTHSASTYALRVRGESMTAPYGRTYPEGCVIFVDPAQKSPVSGARIIAKCEGSDEVTFKVFKQEDGRTWLQPLNPTYPVIRDHFKVLGTIIGKWEDE